MTASGSSAKLLFERLYLRLVLPRADCAGLVAFAQRLERVGKFLRPRGLPIREESFLRVGHVKRVLDLLIKGAIEEEDAKPMLQQAASDILMLESQLSELRSTISSSFEFRSFDEFYKIVSETMPLANSAKSLIDAFVLRVDVFNDHLHVTLIIDQPEGTKKDAPTSDASASCWFKVGVKEGN